MIKSRSKAFNDGVFSIKRMMLFIIIALCISVNINAQTLFIPDSSGTPIKMPERYGWDLRSNFEIGHKSSYRYIVSDTSVYYSVFKKYSRDSVPLIDFRVSELLLHVYCPQCIANCPTNEPCHRNSCDYISSWYIRKKKIAH